MAVSLLVEETREPGENQGLLAFNLLVEETGGPGENHGLPAFNLLVEETGGPGENHRLPKVTDKLYHIMLYISPRVGFELTTSVVIGTDCIGSCKSYYHTIRTTMALFSVSYNLNICYVFEQPLMVI